MFYTFLQNNSGGYFQSDESVCEYVIIEAENADEANTIAYTVGIYFDGVSENRDCPCCGDRWTETWEDDGTEQPTIWDEPLTNVTAGYCRGKAYVYYRNGDFLVHHFAKG